MLGIGTARSSLFKEAINSGCEGIKPGWVRVNFNYFCPAEVFEFVIDAVGFIADDGWKLLPLYDFEAETGLWCHRDGRTQGAMRLEDLDYAGGKLNYRSVPLTEPVSALRGYLERARKIAAGIEAGPEAASGEGSLTDELENLRWFLLPR